MSVTEKHGLASRGLVLLLFLLILVAAAWLRFHDLDSSPGWYADEGSDMDIATHLMHGRMQYLAVRDSALIAARPPLFHLCLAGLFSLFGRDIVVLRALTAFYGLSTVLLLFIFGRQIWGPGVALLASALYAVYPGAVACSRFGFLYNQTAVLYLFLFYGLWRFRAARSTLWLGIACLAAGLSLLTGVNSLPILGFMVMVLVLTHPAVLFWALPLICLPPLLYGGWMMAAAPESFVYDLQFIIGRVGGSPFAVVLFAFWNWLQLLREDVWFLLGAFGLTRLPVSSGRLYTNLFFWYVLLTTVAGVPEITGLAYHHAISLMPWAAVGVSSFLFWAGPLLARELEAIVNRLYRYLPDSGKAPRWQGFVQKQGRLWAVGLTLSWSLMAPFVASAVELEYQIRHGLTPVPPEVEQVTVTSFDAAKAAIEYVNQAAGPEALVIAPPHVAWLVKARVADFQQATAYSGGSTQNYPDNVPEQRFLYDCSIDQAQFAVFWSGWREWAGSVMPDVDATFRVVETWPVVFERGSWRVYKNPSPPPFP